MKIILTTLVFSFLSLPLVGLAQTVTGTSFNLVDGGDVTAQLTTSREGTPTLFFFDEQNVPRISIGLYEDGAPGVVLNDNNGQAAALLRLVQSNGDPVLVLKEDGQDRVIVRESGINFVGDTGNTSSFVWVILLGLLSGFVGAYLHQYINTRRVL